ncbi:hypothetical protein CRYUN_Cryun37aG0136400 [Craigia yunnanensis]
MNASATVGVGIFPSTSKPLSKGLSSIPIRLRWRRMRCLMIEVEAELSASEAQSVSRRLILLRHAKSSWQHPPLRDHDRPLSKIGRADAALVSQTLQHMGWIPQLILSSDALRTRETLDIMQEQVRGFLEAEVHFISSFYSIAALDGQTAEHLQRTICQYSRDEILTIMCMGHNRGWEEAASMFTGASIELKTCNAALLEATGKSWEEVTFPFFIKFFLSCIFCSRIWWVEASRHSDARSSLHKFEYVELMGGYLEQFRLLLETDPVKGNTKEKASSLSLSCACLFLLVIATSILSRQQPKTCWMCLYLGGLAVVRDSTLIKKKRIKFCFLIWDTRGWTFRDEYDGGRCSAQVSGTANLSKSKMIDQFINFVIRPPRADYIPDQYLWEREFTLAGRQYKRLDLELTNARGHMLRCSHYMPSPFHEETPLPCVIYCHGNSGCRADANEAAVILLPSNITVFTLDFSGSGLSDGDYVSLGWHERDDLKIVVSYLRSEKQISRIGLWGRSMGAVTSLLYGAEDPSIAGMVLDSAFSNLFDLMMELVDVYKILLPKFTVKMAVQYMRRAIQKKAKFDIMGLNCLKGDKNIIKFDGDHNSSRPQFYYDSVSIFFYNVLRPPQVSSACSSKLEKYYDLGDLKVGAGMDESLLYEIITGLQSASTNVARFMLSTDNRPDSDEPSNLQDKPNGQSDECCSYTSSNRESWGRCSSLGGSDEESSADCTTADNSHQVTLNVLATPMKSMQQKLPDPSKEEKMKKRAPTAPKKPKHEKFKKLEALSKRLRRCILKGVNHRRHRSS